MFRALEEALAGLPAPTSPKTNHGGNNPKLVPPNEGVVNKECSLALCKRYEKIYTNLSAKSMKPATKVGTHHGLFSGRSYDVGFGPNDSDFPQHAIENKVLPSENSGGWQTIRGFLGATLLTAVDSNQNPNTNYHAVLVLPTSEYSRDTRSMRCLKATVGKQLELVIEPSIASTDKTGFHEAYNEYFTVIKPKTRGHIGAMFAKFPSHASSFVGLYRRRGVLRAKWDVSTVIGGEYTAIVHSVSSFDADLPDGITLEYWWP